MRFTLLILVFFVLSCNNSNVELESMRQENIALSSELRDLKDEINRLELQVVVLPEKYDIMIGEEYSALAFFAIVNDSFEISAYVRDFESSIRLRDESTTVENFNGHIVFKSNPKIPGKYGIEGELKMSLFGKEYDRLFYVDYEVYD